MYGKQTETAIAAMSRLAEVYDGTTRLSATDIAQVRGLQRPFVGKILSALSQAGLVDGTPGPGGGYRLARPPAEITVHDVYRLFEREDESRRCPFGGGVCGVGEPCALHEKLVSLQDCLDELHATTFERFRVAFQEEGLRPVSLDGEPLPDEPRETYRASRQARGGVTR